MSRLKTKVVEEIYSVLEKFAEAKSNYYDREGFIYCFGVVPNPPNSFELSCMDGRRRTIIKNGNALTMIGKGATKVNQIINKILEINEI